MREKLDELARLHAHRFDDDVALSAWREATIGDAFPAILAYVRGLTAERDQLRAQLATASNNARHYADKCVKLEAQEAERDQLRAEVERLRGQSKAALLNAKQSQDGWSEALKLRDSATARAEVAERECVEYIDYRNQAVISRNAMERERDEARAHAEDLCGALSDELSWARAYGPCQAPHVKRCMCPHCVTERSKAALARTPAQSLGRIKAEALRSVAEQYIKPFLGFNEGWYGDGVRDAYNAVKDAAEELKKEATDAR